jgi:CheY-like chemotaxis protein
MSSPAELTDLAHRRVLVVEDEYFIADDMTRALRKLGAEIVGPVPTKDEALKLIASDSLIDAAILDINLRGEAVFPVAEALNERAIPFVFATGYDAEAIPVLYKDVRLWEKPFEAAELARALSGLLRPREASPSPVHK